MAVQLRRPILVGGIGLSFGLWVLGSIHESVAEFGEVGVLGAIALGTGWWFLQQRRSTKIEVSSPSLPLDRAVVEKAIAQAEPIISYLETEIGSQEQLRQRIIQLTAELDRQQIQLTVTGGKGVGKTKLLQLLESQWIPQQEQHLSLHETHPLFIAKDTTEVIPNSDLVLVVITGDLTDTEFQTLQQLKAVNQRTLLVFNKQDQYLPPERALIWQQLRQRVAGILGVEDVVAIAAAPNPVKVRQHQSDASIQEWMEEQTPNLTALTQRLSQILTQESQQLIWTSIIREAT
ncbi:MAG TPA: hypothetical protein DCL61_09990, partial [Cyanobacteria bacterium UBA12227]|nr:hypothetical protein [Cyanobacteria bacterium UBA12227]